jgi:hypothetical protein
MACSVALSAIVLATDLLPTLSDRISRCNEPVTHASISISHGSERKWGARLNKATELKGKKSWNFAALSLSSHIMLDL